MKTPERPQQKAARIAAENPEAFLGGPLAKFETSGRTQLSILLQEGLYPHSKVLDIGCGCLSGGYWLIHFLRPGHYFGIEPNSAMLELGRAQILGPELVEEKRPRFDSNDRFDFSAFETHFDFFVACAIWTHAAKPQIEHMLDGFVAHSAPEAVFVTTYLPARNEAEDYPGSEWVGRSHQSQTPGEVRHSLRWIESACGKLNLQVSEIGAPDAIGQRWLKITRRGAK